MVIKDKAYYESFNHRMEYLHIKKGTKIANKALDECSNEMTDLLNYINKD